MEDDGIALGYALADRLPDVPRWVEARSMLRGGACEILGVRQGPELSFVILDPDFRQDDGRERKPRHKRKRPARSPERTGLPLALSNDQNRVRSVRP